MAAGMVCKAKWSSSSYPTSASMEENSAAGIVSEPSEDNVSWISDDATALHQSQGGCTLFVAGVWYAVQTACMNHVLNH